MTKFGGATYQMLHHRLKLISRTINAFIGLGTIGSGINHACIDSCALVVTPLLKESKYMGSNYPPLFGHLRNVFFFFCSNLMLEFNKGLVQEVEAIYTLW